MNLVLDHEFGHVVDCNHDSTNVSIMYPSYSDRARVLWHEDVIQLRNTNNPHYYNHVTTRQILHKRSVDNGLNWYSEGNLQEFTNSKIGVAFNPDSNDYLVAWTGTDGSGHINTILGDGVYYHDKITLNITSDMGPSVAYGNGKYVLTYVSTNDNRHIYYIYSYNGTTWYGPVEVQYKWNSSDTAGTYGSMFEPVITYDSTAGVFVLMWVNWSLSGPINILGKIRVCTSSSPSFYQNFNRCKELSYYSNATPGLVCQANTNDCMVVWTDHTGGDDHKMLYHRAYVDSNEEFILYGGTYWSTSWFSTRLAPDLAFGSGYWMLGWRGNDNNTWGNAERMQTSSFPNWSNRTLPDSLLQVSPTLQFASAWSEFAYYYLRR